MDGRVIAGKYRLIRVLGKGAMGAVWLAEHVTLGSEVAIKLMHHEIASNPNARARFDREAQLVARIQSAHVVRVLDHGMTDDGSSFIAMERLTGESLRERLATRGRLPVADVARVVSHVTRAMTKAHEAGLIHRDLKPDNIFVSIDDDGETFKVLDFGVAKASDALGLAGMDPTRTGALVGTPYYMSPEQAQGARSLDARADLWALGVVVYECLTGQRPFTAPALGPLIAKIMAAPIEPISTRIPGVPREVDAWMQKALERDPNKRFQTARELGESFLVAAGAAESMERVVDAARTSAAPAPILMGSAGGTLIQDEPTGLGGTVLMASSVPRSAAPMPSPPTPPAPEDDLVATRLLPGLDDSRRASTGGTMSPASAPPSSALGASLPALAVSQPGAAPVAQPSSRAGLVIAIIVVLLVASAAGFFFATR
jgi:serine/threonine-protein kinase